MQNLNCRDTAISTNSNNLNVCRCHGGHAPKITIDTEHVTIENVEDIEEETYVDALEDNIDPRMGSLNRNDADDLQEAKLMTVKETIESYGHSLVAFQRWFETIFEQVLATFDDVRWLEEQILLHPYVQEHEGIGRYTPLLLAKAYARQGQQIEQIIGDDRKMRYLNDPHSKSHCKEKYTSPCFLFYFLRDAIFAAAISVLKMVDSSPDRQRAKYQGSLPKDHKLCYNMILSRMCSVDSPTPSSGYASDSEFYNEADDPRGPIKESLERTVKYLQHHESAVHSFLVKGDKKLFIQTRNHPRPSFLLHKYCELLYESVWEEFYREYHLIRRLLDEIEFLIEQRQPTDDLLRNDIMKEFSDWPGPFTSRCKHTMGRNYHRLWTRLNQRCMCSNVFHFVLASA